MSSLYLIEQAAKLFPIFCQVFRISHDVVVCIFGRERPNRHIVSHDRGNAIIGDGCAYSELERDTLLDIGRLAAGECDAWSVLSPTPSGRFSVKLVNICGGDIAQEAPKLN